MGATLSLQLLPGNSSSMSFVFGIAIDAAAVVVVVLKFAVVLV